MDWKKAVGIGLLGFGLGLSINGDSALDKSNLEQRIEHYKFNKLWSLVTKYNKKRNDFYQGKISEDEITPRLEEAIEYSRNNFPELFTNNKFDYLKFEDFCRKNKKIYAKLNSINGNEQTIILGNIIEEYAERFSFKGREVDYNVVLFEKEGKDLGDILKYVEIGGWFDRRTNTVGVNITGIKESANTIYSHGSNRLLEENDFFDLMMKELYNEVMEIVKKEDSVKEREIFKRKFVEIITRSTINHERIHFFYPYLNNFEEGRRNEVETFLYQIAEDLRFNSWVFLAADANIGYKRFYEEFKKEGFTKEELVKLRPEERSRIAKEMLNKR